MHIANEENINYQLEIEESGSSNSALLQKCHCPADWYFVDTAISNIHLPYEIINKNDIFATLKLNRLPMEKLV